MVFDFSSRLKNYENEISKHFGQHGQLNNTNSPHVHTQLLSKRDDTKYTSSEKETFYTGKPIKYTYSPWAGKGPRAPLPPQILREWYHFVPWTLLSDILHVNIETVGMNSGGGHFSKWPPFQNYFCLYLGH